MNELLSILNDIGDAPDIITELVYEHLGGRSIWDYQTGEMVECGELTWEEAAALVERGLNTWT